MHRYLPMTFPPLWYTFWIINWVETFVFAKLTQSNFVVFRKKPFLVACVIYELEQFPGFHIIQESQKEQYRYKNQTFHQTLLNEQMSLITLYITSGYFSCFQNITIRVEIDELTIFENNCFALINTASKIIGYSIRVYNK